MLTCDDDSQAIAEMETHAPVADGAELWLEERLVRRIAPMGPAA